MTGEDRRQAGRLALQLQRAGRELARAVQAAGDGDEAALDHVLRAELDVDDVRRRLLALRRALFAAPPPASGKALSPRVR